MNNCDMEAGVTNTDNRQSDVTKHDDRQADVTKDKAAYAANKTCSISRENSEKNDSVPVLEMVFSFNTAGVDGPSDPSDRQYLKNVIQSLTPETMEKILSLNQSVKTRLAIFAHGREETQKENKQKRRLQTLNNASSSIKYVDFITDDVNALTQFVEGAASQEVSSRRTTSHCYELVLRRARRLSWTPRSRRVMVVVGCSPPHCGPHPGSEEVIHWEVEARCLAQMGVTVHTVQVKLHDFDHEFYRKVAEITEGCHVVLEQQTNMSDVIVALANHIAGTDFLEEFEQELLESEDDTLSDDLQRLFYTLRAHAESLTSLPDMRSDPGTPLGSDFEGFDANDDDDEDGDDDDVDGDNDDVYDDDNENDNAKSKKKGQQTSDRTRSQKSSSRLVRKAKSLDNSSSAYFKSESDDAWIEYNKESQTNSKPLRSSSRRRPDQSSAVRSKVRPIAITRQYSLRSQTKPTSSSSLLNQTDKRVSKRKPISHATQTTEPKKPRKLSKQATVSFHLPTGSDVEERTSMTSSNCAENVTKNCDGRRRLLLKKSQTVSVQQKLVRRRSERSCGKAVESSSGGKGSNPKKLALRKGATQICDRGENGASPLDRLEIGGATSSRVYQIKRADPEKREDVLPRVFTLSHLSWSPWKLIVSPDLPEEATDQWEQRKLNNGCQAYFCTNCDCDASRASAPSLYEIALKPERIDLKRVVFYKFVSGVAQSAVSNWETLLLGDREDVKQEVSEAVKRKCSVFLRRATFSEKSRLKAVLQAALSKYDYAWNENVQGFRRPVRRVSFM